MLRARAAMMPSIREHAIAAPRCREPGRIVASRHPPRRVGPPLHRRPISLHGVTAARRRIAIGPCRNRERRLSILGNPTMMRARAATHRAQRAVLAAHGALCALRARRRSIARTRCLTLRDAAMVRACAASCLALRAVCARHGLRSGVRPQADSQNHYQRCCKSSLHAPHRSKSSATLVSDPLWRPLRLVECSDRLLHDAAHDDHSCDALGGDPAGSFVHRRVFGTGR
jgi:hypothetical protein